MVLRYLSAAWLEEVRRRLESSPEFLKAAKDMDASMLNVITEAPDGRTVYLYYRFSNGKILELEVGGESLLQKQAELRATGSYQTFSQISQGKIGLTVAFFQRKIRLEGNMGAALRYVRPIDTMNRILRTVATEY